MSKLDQSTVLKKALLVTVQQAEQIAEKSQRIAELSQRIFEREALVEQLREELGKNSSNSSKPPSSDSPSQREKNRRKRMRNGS